MLFTTSKSCLQVLIMSSTVKLQVFCLQIMLVVKRSLEGRLDSDSQGIMSEQPIK